MAVVKMKRVYICALRKHRKRILEDLQRMGVMETQAVKDMDAEYINTAPQKAMFERHTKEAEQALEIIDCYSPQKASMLDALVGRPYVKKKYFDKLIHNQDRVMARCSEILRLSGRITALEGRIQRIKGEIEALQPWLECDIPMGTRETESTELKFGTLSAAVTEGQISKALDELAAKVQIVSRDKNTKYVVLIAVKRDAEKAYTALRSLGFAKPTVTVERVPSKHIERRKRHISESEAELEKCISMIKDFAKRRGDIMMIADYYRVRAEKYSVLGTLMHTKKTFFITGYVPEKHADMVVKQMGDKYGAAAEAETCADRPVELENSDFAASFEPILESYGLPKRKELDPSAIMGVFYVFLFGLMLSDAAYGAIISIACFALLERFKNMEQSMRRSLRMFMYCGISTLMWGILFGGYFGDAVNVISKTFFHKEIAIPALWFVPLNDPMRMLIYSMLFGIIHLFTGLGIKGYMLLRDGHVKDFICDVVSWFMLLIGLLLLLVESPMYASLAGSSIAIGTVGDIIAKILAAAGALIILLTAGRGSKNPALRLAKGAYGLYGITNWLSDLLSYSRLLALGLATGVIAQVINTMGTMAGNGIVGIVLFIAVFVFGHIFNLAINLLGAYVHTNRLQYVEFLGKFYEGGARKFNPFRENTEYIKVEEDI